MLPLTTPLKHVWPAKLDMKAKYKHITVHIPPRFTCRKLNLEKERALFYKLRLKNFLKFNFFLFALFT